MAIGGSRSTLEAKTLRPEPWILTASPMILCGIQTVSGTSLLNAHTAAACRPAYTS